MKKGIAETICVLLIAVTVLSSGCINPNYRPNDEEFVFEETIYEGVVDGTVKEGTSSCRFSGLYRTPIYRMKMKDGNTTSCNVCWEDCSGIDLFGEDYCLEVNITHSSDYDRVHYHTFPCKEEDL